MEKLAGSYWHNPFDWILDVANRVDVTAPRSGGASSAPYTTVNVVVVTALLGREKKRSGSTAQVLSEQPDTVACLVDRQYVKSAKALVQFSTTTYSTLS